MGDEIRTLLIQGGDRSVVLQTSQSHVNNAFRSGLVMADVWGMGELEFTHLSIPLVIAIHDALPPLYRAGFLREVAGYILGRR